MLTSIFSPFKVRPTKGAEQLKGKSGPSDNSITDGLPLFVPLEQSQQQWL